MKRITYIRELEQKPEEKLKRKSDKKILRSKRAPEISKYFTRVLSIYKRELPITLNLIM
jgi:hypothetical protein